MRTAVSFLLVVVIALTNVEAQVQVIVSGREFERSIWQIAYHHEVSPGVLWAWNLPKIDLERVEKLYKNDQYNYTFEVGDTIVVPLGDSNEVSYARWGWDVVWPYSWVRGSYDPTDWLVSWYKPFGKITRGDSLQVQVYYGRNMYATIVHVRIYETPIFRESNVYIINGRIFWARGMQPREGSGMLNSYPSWNTWDLDLIDVWLVGLTLKTAGAAWLPEYIQHELKKAGVI